MAGTGYIDTNGNRHIISGMITGELPKYTMAEYTALTNKPINWICTDYDATSEYGINATEVKYDSNNSVKDMIDIVTENKTNWYVRRCGNIVSVYIAGNITMDSTGYISTEAMSEQFRPTTTIKPTVFTKVYNGSNYVDCQVMVGEDGKLRFRDNFGNAISGIQTQYIKSDIITYIR